MSGAELTDLRVAVIGVGLIGGSLARALKAAGAAREILGVSRSASTLEQARELGVIDQGETDPAAAADSDIVVIATPVRAIPGVMQALAPGLGPDTIVTDVGSVKAFVCHAAAAHLGEARRRFVPGHPIAGTERTGVEASFATLFDRHTVILTPDQETSADATARVAAMWRLTGATVVEMAPGPHDEILAATSHLPHMVAYALVNCLAGHPRHEDLFRLAAGGFYDFTRIASSDAVMWRDIGMTNTGPLLAALRRYRGELDKVIEALEAGDAETLERLFTDAKTARDLGLAARNGGQ